MYASFALIVFGLFSVDMRLRGTACTSTSGSRYSGTSTTASTCVSLRVNRNKKVCADDVISERLEGSDLLYYRSGLSWDMLTEYTDCVLVGKGSYGEVVSAMSESGNMVAIKRVEILEDNLSSDWENGLRLLREVHFLKSLNHPNLSKLIRIFPNNPSCSKVFNQVYIVTKYYSEGSLSGYMPKRLSDVVSIQYQLLSAICYLHENSILHRDVKRENIFVSVQQDGTPSVVLGDFGLARTRRPEMTCEVVTKPYRCPSLVLGETHYGGEIDVYAAGLVLWEMLIGKANCTLLPNRKIGVKAFLKYQWALCGGLGSHGCGNGRLGELAQRMHIDLDEFSVACTATTEDRMIAEWKSTQIEVASEFRNKRWIKRLTILANKMVAFNPSDRITAKDALCDPVFASFTDNEKTVQTCPSLSENFDTIIRPLETDEERGFCVKSNIWNYIHNIFNGNKRPQQMEDVFPGESIFVPVAKRTRSSLHSINRVNI